MVKLCCDCKWHVGNPRNYDGFYEWLCSEPSRRTVSLVTGEETCPTCVEERYYSGKPESRCGADGKYWEAS